MGRTVSASTGRFNLYINCVGLVLDSLLRSVRPGLAWSAAVCPPWPGVVCCGLSVLVWPGLLRSVRPGLAWSAGLLRSAGRCDPLSVRYYSLDAADADYLRWSLHAVPQLG